MNGIKGKTTVATIIIDDKAAKKLFTFDTSWQVEFMRSIKAKIQFIARSWEKGLPHKKTTFSLAPGWGELNFTKGDFSKRLTV